MLFVSYTMANPDKPLHIALTTPAWPVGVPNGIVTYVHNIRLGLMALGHKVSVFTGTVPVGPNIGDAYLMTEGWQFRWRQRWARLRGAQLDAHERSACLVASWIARVHERDPIDIVEMEETQGWFTHVQSRLPMPVVAKLHGPGCLTEFDSPAVAAAAGTRVWREGQALRAARFVSAPSMQALQRTLDYYQITSIEHAVLPNPVVSVTDETLRWQCAAAQRKTLLYVGRFEYVKGGDVVLKAFRLALDRDPALRLLFVGPNDKTIELDGKSWTLQQALEAWFTPAQRAAVEVMGSQSAQTVAQLRRRARATVMCSRFETQSMVVLEAMAQGCPVLATAAGGVVEFVEHEHNGLLAPSEDIASIAAQMLRLVDDDALATRLGQAGHAWVAQRLHPQAAAALNVQWYRHVIAKAGQ
jgi:glycosyltransferase involved in cell wall biosynthesis